MRLFPAEYAVTVSFAVAVAGSFRRKLIETDLLKTDLASAGIRSVKGISCVNKLLF